jgi:hypothetical protein
MGTTFVTLRIERSDADPGFWMNDGMLEIWLRLLSLHLPEPGDHGDSSATIEIRNRWLFASRGYCMGCVPHDMGFACSTEEGRNVVRSAIRSLLADLERSTQPLDPHTLNLFGFEDPYFSKPIDRTWLIDIGHVFLDLMDGKIDSFASSSEIMPGTTPYLRKNV